MYQGLKVVDVHGHMSTPPHFRGFLAGMISLNTPNTKIPMTDEQLANAQKSHLPRVVRGRDNLGVPGMRCGSCHSPHGNNEASRVPGAADWKMPPLSMSWARLPVFWARAWERRAASKVSVAE